MRPLDSMPDADLVRAVAAVVAVPRRDPADSFVLHAPLELLARAELLRHVDEATRPTARARLIALADEYAAAGDPVEPPRPVEFDGAPAAARALAAAIGAGDLDDVDRAATWLGDHVGGRDLAALLAASVAPSLAAAAHACILLNLLPRGDTSSALLRGPARELARHADWLLTWFDGPWPATNASTGSYLDALRGLPRLGVPGSTFIFPLMHQVEASGAVEHLGPFAATGVDPAVAGRVLLRVATSAMLTEPDEHVPYGWTHCLTMPQAVLALAGHGLDARVATAIAATHVAGFLVALAAGPFEAPVAVTDVPADRPDRWLAVANAAAVHEDAHFVKYTLASIHAAHADPAYAPVHLAAAERLARWWAAADAGAAAAEPIAATGT